MTKKLLIAFDFDHTVVEDNTDIVARKLVCNTEIPESIRQISKYSWTQYMREIFKILHKHKVSPRQIIQSMQRIRPTPEMVELFHFLRDNSCDVIIISDSNSVFITEWLKYHNLSDLISEVFTNPSHFDDSDLLKIEMYHEQYSCKLSAVNLCKGAILEQYITDSLARGTSFDVVAFVGDGRNDLCPSLRLRQNDLIFARKGYQLSELLANDGIDYKASLHIWTSAKEIIDVLSQHIFVGIDTE